MWRPSAVRVIFCTSIDFDPVVLLTATKSIFVLKSTLGSGGYALSAPGVNALVQSPWL